ncbi:LysR family transcriptional regulator substrate-binding protein [Mediterraneibacter faecis]
MLTDEPLVLFNTDSVQVMTLTRQFKAAGVNPHIVLNTSQITTLINMVKTNHIGCFLYKSMVDMYPELVGIPVFPAIEQRIGVIWRKGKYQNAVTEKVIRYLKNY